MSSLNNTNCTNILSHFEIKDGHHTDVISVNYSLLIYALLDQYNCITRTISCLLSMSTVVAEIQGEVIMHDSHFDILNTFLDHENMSKVTRVKYYMSLRYNIQVK